MSEDEPDWPGCQVHTNLGFHKHTNVDADPDLGLKKESHRISI